MTPWKGSSLRPTASSLSRSSLASWAQERRLFSGICSQTRRTSRSAASSTTSARSTSTPRSPVIATRERRMGGRPMRWKIRLRKLWVAKARRSQWLTRRRHGKRRWVFLGSYPFLWFPLLSSPLRPPPFLASTRACRRPEQANSADKCSCFRPSTEPINSRTHRRSSSQTKSSS